LMCICGEKLAENLKCPACNKQHKKTDQGLSVKN